MKKSLKNLIALSCMATSVICGFSQSRIVEFDNPEMKVFLPPADLATGKAVVIFPGGAYFMTAIGHEGYDWAPFFNDKGVACAVVNYKMPHGNRDIPFGDAEAAIKIMKDSAENWKINPSLIGVMGSSAGGHLASTMATHSKEGLTPGFQILFYPVISMQKDITHEGSRINLLGEAPQENIVDLYSNEKQVTPNTPRAFIALSSDDTVVVPQNSLLYYDALQKAGVPATLIIYPTGNHGWGHGKFFKYHDNVIYELSDWLDSF